MVSWSNISSHSNLQYCNFKVSSYFRYHFCTLYFSQCILYMTNIIFACTLYVHGVVDNWGRMSGVLSLYGINVNRPVRYCRFSATSTQHRSARYCRFTTTSTQHRPARYCRFTTTSTQHPKLQKAIDSNISDYRFSI